MAAARAPADPLIVRSVEFVGGMARAGEWRPERTLPEVAFAGRSNVGKSSLLNRLLRRHRLARVSRTPGRTREINFFRVNDVFLVADLPGYGYARVSKAQQADWRPLIEDYLRETPTLRGVVQLFDVRRDPTEDDLVMMDFLAATGTPMLGVITKVDKLSTRQAAERVATISAQLDLDEEQLIPFSAVTGEGRDEIAAAVAGLVEV